MRVMINIDVNMLAWITYRYVIRARILTSMHINISVISKVLHIYIYIYGLCSLSRQWEITVSTMMRHNSGQVFRNRGSFFLFPVSLDSQVIAFILYCCLDMFSTCFKVFLSSLGFASGPRKSVHEQFPWCKLVSLDGIPVLVSKFKSIFISRSRNMRPKHSCNTLKILHHVFPTTSEPFTVFWLNYLGDKTKIMQVRVGNQDEIIEWIWSIRYTN